MKEGDLEPNLKRQKHSDYHASVCSVEKKHATKELLYEKGTIIVLDDIILADTAEKLHAAVRDQKTFFKNYVRTDIEINTDTKACYSTILCMNAPWTSAFPNVYPEVHEVQQNFSGTSRNSTRVMYVCRVYVDCAALDDTASLCEITSRLPCVQLWCNGRKKLEKSWNSALAKLSQIGIKERTYSVPLPLSLPFDVPVITSDSSENRIRLLRNLPEGQDYASTGIEKYAVLVVSASWCAPCQKLKPQLPSMSQEYEDYARFFLCDYDEYPEVRRFYNIVKIPTIAVVDISNGKVHGTLQHSDETKVRGFLDQTMKVLRMDDDF